MKKYKSQNNEAELAISYFGERNITILDVGANDGQTFSNSYDLIKLGNTAYCFEPSSICADLIKLHRGNPNVHIYNKGLGAKAEKITFYESGAHVKGGRDRALVSTTDFNETIRWRKAGVEFTEKTVQILDWAGWYDYVGKPTLEFISIDTEGKDWEILQQIDLGETKTEFLIIEFNGNVELAAKYIEYCGKFGLAECGRNSENLLFCVPKTP